ncbi:MAG: hypothetical protein JW889_00665 [Verrucomicrobia bacterium]|nr:hypothetical protein [Verrucomicrobiota bacterium]
MKPNDKQTNTDDLLIDYALGEIDPKDKVRVELMLAQNPELMREARALKRMASHMGVSMITPSPQLTSRVRHAAYEARARRGGWRFIGDALRRPMTAAVAGLVVAALVIALVGPSVWRTSDQGTTTSPVGDAGSMPEDLRTFLRANQQQLQKLRRGEALDSERFSIAAGNAMVLAEKATDSQRAVLVDIEVIWRHGHDRVNSVGYLSDDIVMELKNLAAQKQLIDRIEQLLDAVAKGE